jgi:soluble lytic murein transglycosylase-like protein
MKLYASSPFRFLKFAPVLLVALFLFANFTGIFVGHAFAPSVEHQLVDEASDLVLEASIAVSTEVPTSGDKKIDELIARAAEKYGVDPSFLHAVIWQESKYRITAHSPAGALGLMQLMPETARRFGCSDCLDPSENIDAGAHYLRWLLERFNGDLSMVLAGYNAGEGSVDKFDGIPPFGETESYVKDIEERYGKSFHPVLEPAEAMIAFR